MNIVREILLYLENNSSSWVVGDYLFQGVFPVGNETGILMYEFGGDENESNLHTSQIQITVQEVDYDTANETIHSVWDMLIYNKGITLGNGKYLFNTTPMKYPGFVTTTEHDLFVFTCSFATYYEGD